MPCQGRRQGSQKQCISGHRSLVPDRFATNQLKELLTVGQGCGVEGDLGAGVAQDSSAVLSDAGLVVAVAGCLVDGRAKADRRCA